LSPFQSVERDFSFIVESNITAENIVRAALMADRDLITDVVVFDVFNGGSLGAEELSIGITVKLEPTKATLTDSEIEAVSEKIIANIEKQTGGSLRG
jgi:phenylalanyl-tRNA synthetase beta chain